MGNGTGERGIQFIAQPNSKRDTDCVVPEVAAETDMVEGQQEHGLFHLWLLTRRPSGVICDGYAIGSRKAGLTMAS